MRVIATPAFLEDLAAAAAVTPAATGPLLAAVVDLFKSDIAVDANTPLATLTAALADFTGYAQKTITWSVVSTADDGTVELLGSVAEWRPSGSVVQNGIYGFFVRSSGGTLYFVARMENPPDPMRSALDSIRLTIRYRPADNSIGVEIS